ADAPFLELRREALKSHCVLRDDHHSGSVFVQSMDDSGTALSTDSFEIRTVVQKRIHKGTTYPSCGRMHHNPGGLVNHDAVVVLVQDFQRNGFRLWRVFAGRSAFHLYEIIDFKSSAGFNALTIHSYLHSGNQPLYS